MALTFVNDSATIGTSEYFLGSDSTTKVDQTDDCILQVWLDFSALTSGDQYRVRVYEKVNAGTQRQAISGAIVTGVQSELFVLPSLIVGDGWEVSVTKLTGTDRSIGWSLRKAT